jgi:hypothetical protein
MRFFEFSSDSYEDKFVMILRNFIGRAASKKAPSKLNWKALNQITSSSGFEMGADYESFKAMYDASPTLQNMVRNFNADGIELNVPGAPNSDQPKQGAEDDSEEAIAKMASSAADKQIAQNQATPQV